MSTRLASIFQYSIPYVDASSEPQPIHEGAFVTTPAIRAEDLEIQRIFREFQEVLPIITKIIDTTGEMVQELDRVKAWRTDLNLLTSATAGLFIGAAKCCFSPQCASNAGIEEADRTPRAELLTAVGIVAAASLQFIKIAFFSLDQSKPRATLRRLWTELDGAVPENLIMASYKLDFQRLNARERLSSVKNRIDP
ncbi:MAG: hypothetical protein NTX49_01150 [Chlamydiae bacterium]|nr:hypothetical protein [Chlamydiota bacterium]